MPPVKVGAARDEAVGAGSRKPAECHGGIRCKHLASFHPVMPVPIRLATARLDIKETTGYIGVVGFTGGRILELLKTTPATPVT